MMDNKKTIHSRHVFQTYMTDNVLRPHMYSHQPLNNALISTLSQPKFRASDWPEARITLVSEAYEITLETNFNILSSNLGDNPGLQINK